jgi:membrane protease YdiL (CAAX protease family)
VVILLLWLALSAGVLWKLGVFRADALRGPDRDGGANGAVWVGFALVAMVLWLIAGVGAVALLPGLERAGLTGPVASLWATAAANLMTAVGIFVLSLAVIGKPRWPGLPRMGLDAAIGLASLAAVLPVLAAVALLTQWVSSQMGAPMQQKHEVLIALADNPSNLMIGGVVASAVLAAPILEEVLFRGVLQTALLATVTPMLGTQRQPAARLVAILVTSAAFALLHPDTTWPSIFCLSVALGYLYERTGRLTAPIILHAAFNAANVAMTVYQLRG